MASTISVGSNYVGEAAGEYIGAAFKEADTIQKGLVTVHPNIKYQEHLKKIAYADGRVDYTCGFQPTGTVTLSEKILAPKKIKNELEICKEDLVQIWSAATMGFSAHNDQMPTDVDSALIAEILADTAAAVDADIWQGDEDNTGEFDGFLTLFAADASIIKDGNGITGAGAAISKSNVQSELEKVTNAIPIALRRKSDLVIAVSPDVANFYSQALTSPQISNGLGASGHQLQYGIYMLEIVNGLPANTFVVYQKKNLVFGTSLMADFQQLRIKDMDESDLSDQVRYKMVYAAGTQYYNSAEIVWYLSTT